MLRVRRIFVSCIFAATFVLACAAQAATCLARAAVKPTPTPTPSSTPQPKPTPTPSPTPAPRTLYRINLALDFDRRSYEGTERVRWVNADDRAASVLFFHLYPNLRADEPQPQPRAPMTTKTMTAPAAAGAKPPTPNAPADAAASSLPPAPDEPGLEVTAVRALPSGTALAFTLDEARVTLRVQLREAVAAGGAAEVEIKFKGSVPEIDADETSLTAHLMQQVGAALQDTREQRRARDINFHSRGVVLLGSFHPVLAARAGGDWRREVEPTLAAIAHADAADYEVEIVAPADVALYTSGSDSIDAEASRPRVRRFTGEGLRGFAVVAGRSLRSQERESAGVRVRAVYAPEHERTARRVLDVSAEAVRVFAARFGPLPFKSYTVAEAPLVAGMGSAEFSGLSAIASAFYADFDAPAMRRLPEVVREQRASVEDSLEFAAAHMAAHQWWGAAAGSDSAREPVVDEALANWSALLYYQDARGVEPARAAADEQLRGVYEVYRTFGGEDMPADRPAREYRNSFQYAAIVSAKGALMLEALRPLLGERRFFEALRGYYETHRLRVATLDDLQEALAAGVNAQQRRLVARLFERWLAERHGDEDIAPPNPQLAAALGISLEPGAARDRNALSRFGRFFWRRMTRIR